MINDEEFFDDQPVPAADTLATSHLTQSAAYRQMLTSTQSTVKSHLSYIDSDDNDDVEEILDLSPQKPMWIVIHVFYKQPTPAEEFIKLSIFLLLFFFVFWCVPVDTSF